jgi:hypothetical protein
MRPRSSLQAVIWLLIAAAFAHLYVDADGVSQFAHWWFAILAAAAVILAILTGAIDSRRATTVSAAAAAAITLLAVVLLRLHIAHETGVLLLVSGALNVTIGALRLASAGQLRIGRGSGGS